MDDHPPGTPPKPRQIPVSSSDRLHQRNAGPVHGETDTWVAKVEIYTRRFCADSMRTKGIFDRKNIQYNEYLVDGDIVNSSAMSQRTEGLASTPQVFIDGNLIGGLRQVLELEQAGQLDFLLGIGA